MLVNQWETSVPAFKTSLPCPECGVRMVLGFLLLNPDGGRHQHTHYVCLSWPHPGEQCGWHGWTVTETWTMQLGDITVLGTEIRGDLWVAPLGSPRPEVDMSAWVQWWEYTNALHEVGRGLVGDTDNQR